MSRLPDPRRFPEYAADNRLALLASASHAGDQSSGAALIGALRHCVKSGSDDELSEALRAASSPGIYRHLWNLVCSVADRSLAAEGERLLAPRSFAIPLVLVAQTNAGAVIPGVVPDIGEVTRLLEQHGAIGSSRNIGLSNALCPLEAMEGLQPSRVYGWTADFTAGGVPREIEARDIDVARGREQVHLRFLIGAGIAPNTEPSFLETASNVGAWGVPLTRLLARQLAQPGLELLPVARPPAGILKAAHAGRYAQLELAFDLFVSNTVRRFRSTVGEPRVVVSAHRSERQGAEIRVSLSSALDDMLLEGFRWPLHPLDELDRIDAGITGLLHECRVDDVRILTAVVIDSDPSNRQTFIRAADFDRLLQNAAPH
jgi:hypothetical protein